jgi:hypothetical protein
MSFSQFELDSSKRSTLETRLRADLRLLDPMVEGAEKLRRASLLGALWGGLGRLVGFASRGPTTYRAPFDSTWIRPANIAGSGCVVLGMFLLFGGACVVVAALEYPLAAGALLGLIALLAFRGSYLTLARRKALRLHWDQVTQVHNHAELAIAGTRTSMAFDAYSGRAHVGFVAHVRNGSGRSHGFYGEALYLLGEVNVERVYLVLGASTEPLSIEASREARQQLYDDLSPSREEKATPRRSARPRPGPPCTSRRVPRPGASC